MPTGKQFSFSPDMLKDVSQHDFSPEVERFFDVVGRDVAVQGFARL